MSFCVELEAGRFLAFHCFINSLRDDRRLDGKWGWGCWVDKWPPNGRCSEDEASVGGSHALPTELLGHPKS